MAKQKGLGTRVLYRKVNVCNLQEVTGQDGATSGAGIAALNALGFKELGCIFSVKPPGRSFELVEDEACLNDNEVPAFNPTEIYFPGSTVSSGKDCYEAQVGTTLDEDGEIQTQIPAPPTNGAGNATWTLVDCGCAYPSVELGPQEVNELDLSNAYCPGTEETNDLEDACDDLFQLVYCYPRRVSADGNGGFVCRTCCHVFCAKLRVMDPDEVTPTDFMKATITWVRVSKFERFCFEEAA